LRGEEEGAHEANIPGGGKPVHVVYKYTFQTPAVTERGGVVWRIKERTMLLSEEIKQIM
jgi:hypothetical protein